MRKVQVPLADRSYNIHVGKGLLPRLGQVCARLGVGPRCAIISDTNVGPLFARKAEISLRKSGFDCLRITISAGETAKSLRVLGTCYDAMAGHRLERTSWVLALGGGVVGDLAGFAAATYLRGIPFVQAPTTLLAQVDSSVGGKVGVNLQAGKNLVGAFYQPRLVLCDLDTLRTLPDREFRSGLAEVIKYGIIYDAAFFHDLERSMPRLMKRDAAALGATVARCCQIKAEVVGQDEREGGLRAILNFGHTLGHALEAVSGYGKYLHGEAISIGQVLATQLSQQVLGLPAEQAARIESLLAAAGLPTRLHLPRNLIPRLMTAMQLDKKVAGGEIRFVLANAIGKVHYGQRIPAQELKQFLNSQS